jgi:hypothetical protein
MCRVCQVLTPLHQLVGMVLGTTRAKLPVHRELRAAFQAWTAGHVVGQSCQTPIPLETRVRGPFLLKSAFTFQDLVRRTGETYLAALAPHVPEGENLFAHGLYVHGQLRLSCIQCDVRLKI